MIIPLKEQHIDDIMALQEECLDNEDIFLPTSREGYLRAFQFDNFCFGYMEDGELFAFLNCSIPTARAASNLGRGRLPPQELNRVGHMNTLLVRRGCRRHGIGRELVHAVLEEFLRRDCRHIYVTSSPRNDASLHLLDTLSFSLLETIMLLGQRRYLLYRNLEEDTAP